MTRSRIESEGGNKAIVAAASEGDLGFAAAMITESMSHLVIRKRRSVSGLLR